MKKSQLRNIIKEELKIILTEWYPKEVINQLGGNKFIAMTGAKNFVNDSANKTLIFKLIAKNHPTLYRKFK